MDRWIGYFQQVPFWNESSAGPRDQPGRKFFHTKRRWRWRQGRRKHGTSYLHTQLSWKGALSRVCKNLPNWDSIVKNWRRGWYIWRVGYYCHNGQILFHKIPTMCILLNPRQFMNSCMMYNIKLAPCILVDGISCWSYCGECGLWTGARWQSSCAADSTSWNASL